MSDNIADAVNAGVKKGYGEGFLRKSVVRDPLDRVNTGDNTPAMIYYQIAEGDQIKITVAPKGFDAEVVMGGISKVKAYIQDIEKSINILQS